VSSLDSIILDEMAHTQQEILEADSFLPAFLKHEAQFTVTGSHSSINLATQAELSGFLRPINADDIPSLQYLYQGYYQSIKRYDSFAQLKQIHGDGADRTDFPGGYFWNGNPTGVLQVRAQTNGSVMYLASFFRRDTYTPASPDGNGMTRWSKNAGDLLMHATGLEVAMFLRDQDAIAYFTAKKAEAYTRLKNLDTANEMADTDLSMGDD
jgi:hypothetical protein